MQDLSPYVLQQITSGQAILFLGAGVTAAAEGKNGTHGLSSSDLRERLCDKFLGGESKSKPLNYVADRCVSVAGMGSVHRFLKELLGDLSPTPGHLLIPEFRWRGLVTTNYDLLTELAYQKVEKPQQSIERIVWDRDDFGVTTKNQDVVAYLKLHGCLTRINDPAVPLVLSSHDYYKFKSNRTQLTSTLREWGMSSPIIFCGYSIADENVKEILYDLTDKYLGRPQYVMVDPYLEKGDIDYWRSQRFDCIKLSFNDFMCRLRDEISPSKVELGKVHVSDVSISRFIPSHSKPSPGLLKYLEMELEHIHPALLTNAVPPKDFYRGNSEGFAWIRENYDVRRRVIDTLVSDLVIDCDKSKLAKPYFYILSGYAGSGKSVALKRFSWEAASDFNAAVFYIGANSLLRVEEICELSRLINGRIIITLDDALIHRVDLISLLTEAKRHHLPITVVGGVRSNEWNMSSAELGVLVEAEYDLLDLSKNEVQILIHNLDRNGCLGYLEHLSSVDRVSYFSDKLKNQLLVALHEATEGKSFEEIVSDEYQRVTPPEARLLYLDVCSLDRFGVGLRAGLMSRISGVTFEQFSARLLRPLEHVVFVEFDHKSSDYIYRSRHQNIAELVFESAFDSPADKSAQIIRVLRFLNGAYDADRFAIQKLVKGRVLAGEFSDKAYVSKIFDAALESGLHPSVVDHQRAVFELHHSNGDLRAALSLVSRIEQVPGVLSAKTVAHTKANVLRRLASSSKTELERERYRTDALAILNVSTRSARDALPFLTKGQLLLEQLQERMEGREEKSEEEVDASIVGDLTKEIESTLRLGLQHFPEDEKLLSFEAELSKFLNNTPRALRALERAYAKNRDSVYTTIRLARHYLQNIGTRDQAFQMMRKLVLDQPLSKEAHFELARMLGQINEVENSSEIGQHLKRSFSAGDSHLEAQFHYARHQFLFGTAEDARREFASLSKVSLSPNVMQQVRAEIKDLAGNPIWYDGVVVSLHESFAFIRSSDFQGSLFMHFKSLGTSNDWEAVRVGTKIRFTLGFSYKGPKTKRVQILTH